MIVTNKTGQNGNLTTNPSDLYRTCSLDTIVASLSDAKIRKALQS